MPQLDCVPAPHSNTTTTTTRVHAHIPTTTTTPHVHPPPSPLPVGAEEVEATKNIREEFRPVTKEELEGKKRKVGGRGSAPLCVNVCVLCVEEVRVCVCVRGCVLAAC